MTDTSNNVVTPRSRLLAALRGASAGHVPFQELEVSARHVEAVLESGRGVRSTDLPPEDYCEFTLATGQYALYHNALWKAGRVYAQTQDGKAQYVGGAIRDTRDLESIEPFDVTQACERVSALCEAAAAHHLAVILSFPSPFRLALFALGYDAFFLRLSDEPEFIREVIRWFQGRVTPYLAALLQCPVDAFLVGGSVCTGSGPMLSPVVLRALWAPGVREFLAPVTDRGLPVILHMDGDFSSIADLLMEMPFDAIHPFEVSGNLDIYNFQRQYGDRVTVWGNIDLAGVLTRGTPEQVRADVQMHVDRLGQGRRYILSSSHEITEDVPLENFLALVGAAR